jgi:hypothetical protein
MISQVHELIALIAAPCNSDPAADANRKRFIPGSALQSETVSCTQKLPDGNCR